MSPARVELLGGPDCGRTDSLTLPAGGARPVTLPDRDGRRRYHDAHWSRSGVHVYEWTPEVAAGQRAACARHPTPRPGCPGYRSSTSAP